MSDSFDIVILGGGTGGYVAAIRAAQLGLKVAVVEKEKLGGTCLHKGCIPSKALLKSAEMLSKFAKAGEYGIEVEGKPKLRFSKVMERKDKIVSQLYKGVQHLLKKHGVTVIQGHGRLMGPSIFSPTSGTISIEKADGQTELTTPRHVIIATGSRPRTLPGLPIDGDKVITSDHGLQLEHLPKSILIIGAGAIGMEWASMLNDFGVDVTVVEYMDRILPLEDSDCSDELAKLLKRRNVKIVTGAKVLPESFEEAGENVRIQAQVGDRLQTFEAEKILVSIGREANVQDIGLEATEIQVERGVIQVDAHLRTAEPHIFAIGDCIGGLQLAHAAAHEGVHAVETIADLHPLPIDSTAIPRCTYSRPEVASIGLTEAKARSQGYELKVGTFPFRAIGKAQINGDIDGFVKILSDARTQDLLGVHMVGAHVTDMISEAALAKLLDATAWEVAQTIHPHPTLSEAVAEAALAVDGLAIHI
ncbi:dihydrolipoyl dehydrogenase [Fodinisporobacter ferrooxydans]|uniref:Dihydrolipoyl dehydrogenase n=1 Tax=Fodinisporobacter ferrooxydans TaxID=2901836 RepID=A0ABY4CHB7_9BACL|nr:dihydrolipoyl dehydrogenase [Alicyclobacillaceae bacterium MYW30-H2]